MCSWSSGVLEDAELQFQEAVAEPPSKKSNDSAAAAAASGNGSSSPTVVHSDPAILPAPVQQIPPATQEVKALADQQIPAVPEVKQAGILLIPSFFLPSSNYIQPRLKLCLIEVET